MSDVDPCGAPECPRTDVLDGDNPGAHWQTRGSSTIAMWSCSDECADQVEKLRIDGALPVADPEWDGFESRLDLMAATVYNVRAQSPREMTPARWWNIKARFGASARSCLEQAELELQDL